MTRKSNKVFLYKDDEVYEANSLYHLQEITRDMGKVIRQCNVTSRYLRDKDSYKFKSHKSLWRGWTLSKINPRG